MISQRFTTFSFKEMSKCMSSWQICQRGVYRNEPRSMSSQSQVLLINLCTGRRGKGEVERVQNPFSFFFWIEMRSRYVAMVAKFLKVNKPKTSLKKSIRTASNFIDLIQFHLIWQMLAKFFKVAYVAGAKSPIPFDACYTGYSRVESERSVRIKRKTTNFVLCCEIRKFHVPGVQRRQGNAQNRVMQVQICCSVLIKSFTFFAVLLPSPSVVGFVVIQK